MVNRSKRSSIVFSNVGNLVKPEAEKSLSMHRRTHEISTRIQRGDFLNVSRIFDLRYWRAFATLKKQKKRNKIKGKSGEETHRVGIFKLVRDSLLSDRIRLSVSSTKPQYRKVPFPVNHFNYFQAGRPAYLISIFRISRFTWINPAPPPPPSPKWRIDSSTIRFSSNFTTFKLRLDARSLNKHAKCVGSNQICQKTLFTVSFLYISFLSFYHRRRSLRLNSIGQQLFRQQPTYLFARFFVIRALQRSCFIGNGATNHFCYISASEYPCHNYSEDKRVTFPQQYF